MAKQKKTEMKVEKTNQENKVTKDKAPETVTVLGKISYVGFGVKEGRLGLYLVLEGKWGGAQVSESIWDYTQVKRTDEMEWEESEREQDTVRLVKSISMLLHTAKASELNELLGKPVQIVVESEKIKEWRILEEVL